jgi:hypothetical protein
MNKITVALSILAISVITGCSDENTKLKGQFLAGCVQSGVSKSICVCTFDKLEGKYSQTELKAISTERTTLPSSFVKDLAVAARTCQAEH